MAQPSGERTGARESPEIVLCVNEVDLKVVHPFLLEVHDCWKVHLLHCASAVHAGGGSGADWGATMRLQQYWCQSVGVQQEWLVLLVQVDAGAQQIHPD